MVSPGSPRARGGFVSQLSEAEKCCSHFTAAELEQSKLTGVWEDRRGTRGMAQELNTSLFHPSSVVHGVG